MFKLKYIKLNDETFFDIPIATVGSSTGVNNIPNAAVESSVCVTSEDQATMPVNTSVPDEETREGGREGLRISAGVAL